MLNVFRLCPQYVKDSPVTEHAPLSRQSLIQNPAGARGDASAINMHPQSLGAQTGKIQIAL